jgi:hypothetical protein
VRGVGHVIQAAQVRSGVLASPLIRRGVLCWQGDLKKALWDRLVDDHAAVYDITSLTCIIRDSPSGRFAMVQFRTVEEASNFLAFDGMVYNGHWLKVSRLVSILSCTALKSTARYCGQSSFLSCTVALHNFYRGHCLARFLFELQEFHPWEHDKWTIGSPIRNG